MNQLSVILQHFENPEKTIEVKWNINRTPVGALWLKCIKDSLQDESIPFARHTGFVYGPKNMEHLSDMLNRCIKAINKDGRYHIKEKSEAKWDQDFSNAIHHHFELLCGKVENHSQYYKDSSKEIRDAVCGLNHAAHDMESLHRSFERVEKYPETYFSGLIVEMYDCKRYNLPDFALEEFTLNVEFGAIHTNYCQIGKSWWEVFLDEDEHIFPEAIDPHFTLSGGFDAYFGEYIPPEETIKKFEKFLIDNGQDINNKKLSLGYCQVGTLDEADKYAREEWRKLVGEHSKVQEIRLLKDGDIVMKKSIPARGAYSYLDHDYEEKLGL